MSTTGSPKQESFSAAPDHDDSCHVVAFHHTINRAPEAKEPCEETDFDDSCHVVAFHHTIGQAPEVKEHCEETDFDDTSKEESEAQIHDSEAVVANQEMVESVRAHWSSNVAQWNTHDCQLEEEVQNYCNARTVQTCHPSDIEARLSSGSARGNLREDCENRLSGIPTESLRLFSESGFGWKKPCCVAVIGAGGFIASWIVKLLLQRGFHVRGTLRHLDDENTAHLRVLEGARERLELLRANILHLPSLVGVVEGCEGVFHTACPVLPTIADPQAQMLRPAVEGTLNVLRACAGAHVKRVVMTSSIGAVYLTPDRPPAQRLDETCWSDENYLEEAEEWYCLAKLRAERTAWDYAHSHGVSLVTICPGVTLGTMLQPRINQSSVHLLKYLNGSTQTYANLCQAYVDVEDAAEAHVLAFVTPTAQGRYLCCKWSRHRGQVVEALARLCPHYPIPTRCKTEAGEPEKVPLHFCNQKVEQQLGLQFTSFDQTLRNAVASLQAKGILGHGQPNLTPKAS